jgi:hypothetical protein
MPKLGPQDNQSAESVEPDPSTAHYKSLPCLCYACRWGFRHGATLEEIQAQMRPMTLSPTAPPHTDPARGASEPGEAQRLAAQQVGQP